MEQHRLLYLWRQEMDLDSESHTNGKHGPTVMRVTKKPGVSGYRPSCKWQAGKRKDKSRTSNGLWRGDGLRRLDTAGGGESE